MLATLALFCLGSPGGLGLPFTIQDERNVRLNGPLLGEPGDDVLGYAVLPESATIVFHARRRLYSVPDDGSAPAIELHSGEIDTGNRTRSSLGRDFVLPRSGKVAVYRDQGLRKDLYSVRVDGSEPPVLLSDPLVIQRRVRTLSGGEAAVISPDGSWVAFLAEGDLPNVVEVYGVPIDGSAPPVKLNPDYAGVQDVTGCLIGTDSSFVVYRANQEINQKFELYRAPFDGSAPAFKISDDLVAGGAVRAFSLTGDGHFAVYEADQDVNNRDEIYSVPLDGSRDSIQLSPADDADVTYYRILCAPTGDLVAYFKTNTNTVRLVRADGSEEILGAIADGPQSFEFTSDASMFLYQNSGGFVVGRATSFYQRVVYGRTPHRFSLRYRPWVLEGNERVVVAESNRIRVRALDGSSPARTLFVGDVLTGLAVSDARDDVVFAAGVGFDDYLYRAKTDRSRPPALLGDRVGIDLGFSDDGNRVLMIGDRGTTPNRALYSVPLDSARPVRILSQALASEVNPASVEQPEISANGEFVVYVAAQDRLGKNDLYAVPPDRSREPVRLSRPPVEFEVLDFEIAEGSRSVVFRERSPQGAIRLHSVPLDGSSTPVLLSEVVGPGVVLAGVAEYQVAPGGDLVVYRCAGSPGQPHQLYVVPVAGGVRSTLLSRLGDEEGVQREFWITSDAGHAIYRPNSDSSRLLSAPLAGAAAPVNIANAGDPSLRSAAVGGDPRRVVYLRGDGVLFSALADGSAAPALLADDVDPYDYSVAPGSAFVVFSQTDYDIDVSVGGRTSVFSIPMDGSAPPTLRYVSPPNEGMRDAWISSDPHVAFVHGRAPPGPDRDTVYIFRLDDEEPARLLVVVTEDYLSGVKLAPDGRRVLYSRVVASAGPSRTLFSVPVEGGTPVPVGEGLQPGTGPYAISPDSRFVAYSVQPELQRVELRISRIEGGPEWIPVTPAEPSWAEPDTGSLLITPDSRHVLYRSRQAAANRLELFWG